MVRWLWRAAAVIALVCTLVAACGALYEHIEERRDLAAAPPPGRLVDVGGHRLHLWCLGHGTPTVIFESAAGGTSLAWYRVVQDVARFTTACAYDRAGLGYSDAGPSPRTSARIAAELAALVRRSDLQMPVVLVGWSFGGFSVRAYATTYESDIAGLVLVDASHEDQTAQFAAAGIGPGIPAFAPFLSAAATFGVLRLVSNPFVSTLETVPEPIRRFVRATTYRPASFSTNYDEQIHFGESADEIRSSRRTLSLPIVVLTAGIGPVNQIWMPLQRDLARLSTRSCQIIAADSTHMVPYQAPDTIVRAVRAVIEASKTSSVPVCS
jgi:pimeloyl-ACP methyl ester carboxylesterase